MIESHGGATPKEPRVLDTLRTFWKKEYPKLSAGKNTQSDTTITRRSILDVTGYDAFRAERARVTADSPTEPVLADNDWLRGMISSGVDEVSLRWTAPTDPDVEINAGYIGPHPVTGAELYEYNYHNPKGEGEPDGVRHMNLTVTVYPKESSRTRRHAVMVEGTYVADTTATTVTASFFERNGKPVGYAAQEKNPFSKR